MANELDNTIRIFNKYAKQYQDKYMVYAPYAETYDYLATLVAKGSAILDVACGPANISKFLDSRIVELEIYGCDLSTEMIRLAQKNLPSGHFELRDSRDIKAITKRFDVLISGFCFPYLKKAEVKSFIADARECLNTGGIFYLSTMEGDYENSGYPGNSAGDRIFTYYYHAEFLLDQLSKHKFDTLHVERKPFIENGVTTATDLFIYAKAI